MDKFYIVANETKDRDYRVTTRVKSFLENNGKEVYLFDPPEDVECVITIGGDGTLIRAAQAFAPKDVVFVGVNMGTLGFLTDVEPQTLEASLRRLLDGDYEEEERMMLFSTINKKGDFRALNDVVISRSSFMQVIECSIYLNDKFLTSYRADGVIVSTPTGSTGYNISAGGPIAEPSSKIIIITPICAHNLGARPIIMDRSVNIRIECHWRGDDGGAVVSYDGGDFIPLSRGDSIEINESEKKTRFLRFKEESFVTTLSQKLL